MFSVQYPSLNGSRQDRNGQNNNNKKIKLPVPRRSKPYKIRYGSARRLNCVAIINVSAPDSHEVRRNANSNRSWPRLVRTYTDAYARTHVYGRIRTYTDEYAQIRTRTCNTESKFPHCWGMMVESVCMNCTLVVNEVVAPQLCGSSATF